LTEISKQKPAVRFTIEKELHNSIIFYDLSIHCKEKNLDFQHTENPLKPV
jgi:hypothetical protein